MEREFKPEEKKRQKMFLVCVLIILACAIFFISERNGKKKAQEEAIFAEYEEALTKCLNQYSKDDIKRYAIFSDAVGIYIPIEKWDATLSSDREDFCEEVATWVIYSANNSGLWSVEDRIILTFYDLDRNELKHYYLEDN